MAADVVLELEKISDNEVLTSKHDDVGDLSDHGGAADINELEGVKSGDGEKPTGDEDHGDLALYREGNEMTSTLKIAIEQGDCSVVSKWLQCIPPDQVKETVDTVYARGGRNEKRNTLLLAVQHGQAEIVKLVVDAGANLNVEDNALVSSEGRTALHNAAYLGHTSIVKYLLEKGADMEKPDENGDLPIHLASRMGCHGVVEVFIEQNPQCVHWRNSSLETPLHSAFDFEYQTIRSARGLEHCTANYLRTAKCLIDAKADVNAKDECGWTALYLASELHEGTELVKILLENGAEVDPEPALHINKTLDRWVPTTPLQVACSYGCSANVSLLIKHGAKFDKKSLKLALYEGYEDIVKEMVNTPQWPVLMRQTFDRKTTPSWKNSPFRKTTPFREMIRTMPDVAQMILDNYCSVCDPQYKNPSDPDYRLVYNYEFMEDTGNDSLEYEVDKYEDYNYGTSFQAIRSKDEIWHAIETSFGWGPGEFKKENHPLAVMVESNRLNLLTHPVVGSLLHYKWRNFGLYGYLFNLLTYCVFLIFLTTFALIVENPRGQACTELSSNVTNDNASFDCGIGGVRLVFIYICSIIVIFMALIRLILEAIQLILQFPHYFLDWVNWVEVLLIITSIMFVWVFHVDCLCPLDWQWQIGVVAVFLGWIVLIIFVSKFPLTGIYVLMFVNILYTFIKVLLLSILLVVAFGLAFYLAFSQPDIICSPFSTPGLSLLKLMSMTAGDFEFDSIFRQDPAGESDEAQEIFYREISYILWIVFIILMPILLANMLVGLAVDDIKSIQNESELKKLALQVELVLTVEEILRSIKLFRQSLSIKYTEVYPNRKETWRQQIHYFFWGGEKYDTRDSVQKVFTPQQDETEKLGAQSEELLEEVKSFKNENEKLREQADELLEQIKVFKNENEKLREQSEEVLEEVRSFKGENENLRKKTEELHIETLEVRDEVKSLRTELLDDINCLKEMMKLVASKIDKGETEI